MHKCRQRQQAACFRKAGKAQAGTVEKMGAALLDAIAKGTACRPGTYSEESPCPHCLAEMRQRRALALTAWREREHAVLSEAEKQNVSTQTKTAVA